MSSTRPALAADNRAPFLALLVAVCVSGFALRLFELDTDSLWIDEISTATRSVLDPRLLIRELPSFGVGVELPLLYIVTHFFILSFGQSDFILRMPAVIFGALSILLIYKAGSLLWSGREGLIAALLLSINSYHVSYSQEARHYSMLLLLALLTLIFLLKALRENRAMLWAGFAISLSLGLYTHYFAFLYLGPAVAFGATVLVSDFLTNRRQSHRAVPNDAPPRSHVLAQPLVRLAASVTSAGLAYLPWLPTLRHLLSREANTELAGASLATTQSSLIFLRETLVAYTGVGGAAFLLFLALAVIGLATAGRSALGLALLWVGTPFGFFALVGSAHPLHPRYVLFVLPVYLLALARGSTSVNRIADEHIRLAEGRRIGPLVAALGLSLLFLLVGGASLRRYYSSSKEDWRSAAWYLAQNAQPGDVVVADGKRRGWGDAHRVDRGLSYYLEQFDVADPTILHASRGLWSHLEAFDGQQSTVWGVVWYPGRLTAGDSVVVERFHQVAVIRLRHASGDALQDAEAMLQALLHALPSEADFDLHLALGEIYQHRGNCEQASRELQRASHAKPEDTEASRDLTEAGAEWEAICSGGEKPEQAMWQIPGDGVVCLRHDVGSLTAESRKMRRVRWHREVPSRTVRVYPGSAHPVG